MSPYSTKNGLYALFLGYAGVVVARDEVGTIAVSLWTCKLLETT